MERQKINPMSEIYAIGDPSKYNRKHAGPGIVLARGDVTVIHSRERAIGILEVRSGVVPHAYRPEGTWSTRGIPALTYYGRGDDFNDTRRELMRDWAAKVAATFDSRTGIPQLPEWLHFGVYSARYILDSWKQHHDTQMEIERKAQAASEAQQAEGARQDAARARLIAWVGQEYFSDPQSRRRTSLSWVELEALVQHAVDTAPVRS